MRLVPGVIVMLLQLSDPSTPTPRSGPTPYTPTQSFETYQSAKIDPNGSLEITTSDGRTIVLSKEGDQSSFRDPVVSPDRTAVGVQANYPNCCTSYEIPLQLVVYAKGKVHRFKGNGLPIFRWSFADGGTRVAYGQEPVHFGCHIHYELRDIQSERLIASADIPQPCGQHPDPPQPTIPEWVKDLNAGTRSPHR